MTVLKHLPMDPTSDDPWRRVAHIYVMSPPAKSIPSQTFLNLLQEVSPQIRSLFEKVITRAS